MSNLTAYVNGGIEIYVDHVTGESFATYRGYARMAGKSPSTIHDRLERSDRFAGAKYAEVLTADGKNRSVRLVNESFICSWLPKDNPELALKLMQLGVRKFLHTIAGYEPPQQAVVKPMSVTEMLVAQAQAMDTLAKQVEAQESRLAAVEGHTTGHQDYYTLKAYVNLNRINMSQRNWSQTGKRLTDLSKRLGQEIKLVPDAKFGRVQAYHSTVLERWFGGETIGT